MRVYITRTNAGILPIISGIILNGHAIIPHYIMQAYDRSVWSGLASTGSGHLPGTPVLIAIPPINYTMIAVGCALIAIGILLLFAGFARRKLTSSEPVAN